MSDDEIKLDHLHEHKLFLQLLWKQVKKKKLESSHAILASNVKMSQYEAKTCTWTLTIPATNVDMIDKIESELSHEYETTRKQARDCL